MRFLINRGYSFPTIPPMAPALQERLNHCSCCLRGPHGICLLYTSIIHPAGDTEHDSAKSLILRIPCIFLFEHWIVFPEFMDQKPQRQRFPLLCDSHPCLFSVCIQRASPYVWNLSCDHILCLHGRGLFSYEDVYKRQPFLRLFEKMDQCCA